MNPGSVGKRDGAAHGLPFITGAMHTWRRPTTDEARVAHGHLRDVDTIYTGAPHVVSDGQGLRIGSSLESDSVSSSGVV